MQRLETQWLVVHNQTRTVIVVHRWDNTFHCTCGGRLLCDHIQRVMRKLDCKPQPIALPKKKKYGPKFRPIPEQMVMPDWFDGEFNVTRKFR